MFEIKLDAKTEKYMKMFGAEWEERARKFTQIFMYLATKYIHEEILARIPTGADYKSYKESLEMVRIHGTSADSVAYAIRAEKKSEKLENLTNDQTVLYITAKKMRRKDPAIEILVKFSPWTKSTIPFMPTKRKAMIIARKVNAKEAAKVEKARKKDEVKWRKALVKAGKRKKPAKATDKAYEMVKDIVKEALQLEFGIGVKGVAHWRPAIYSLLKGNGVSRMIKSHKELLKTLMEPEYSDWKFLPKRLTKITMAEAKTFIEFQKKLGISIT